MYHLHQYAERTPFEGFEKIRLNDYEVDKLLGDYVHTAIGWVEGRDLLVSKVVLTPEYVRAYVPEGPVSPEYIEIKLPKGVYERALDLSAGPLTPFQEPQPSEDIKLLLGRIQRIAFPDIEQVRRFGHIEVKHLVLNAAEYVHMRRWLKNRHDPCSEAAKLKTGFQGVLYEHEYGKNIQSGQQAPTADQEANMGRSVEVWISRSVAPGYVGTVSQVPPPAWDWLKHKLQKILDEPRP